MSPVVARSHGSQQATSVRAQCPQCGMMVKKKNLDSHMTKKCAKRDPQARKKLHVKPPRTEPIHVVHETVSSRRPRPAAYQPYYPRY